MAAIENPAMLRAWRESQGVSSDLIDEEIGTAETIAAVPCPSIADHMIEAKAIILFYEDELDNLEWIAECDAKLDRSLGDELGRDLDRWENHPEHVKERFRNRARKAMQKVADEAIEAAAWRIAAAIAEHRGVPAPKQIDEGHRVAARAALGGSDGR